MKRARAIVIMWCFAAASGGAACGGSSGKTPDAGSPDDGANGSDATEVPAVQVPWDWVGVVGTGQSLSVGGLGTPPLSTQPSANNLKLSLGGAVVPPFDAALAQLAMVPLTEPIRPDVGAYPSAYPGNIDGETPHSAMASQITALVQAAAARDYVTVHSVVGESGQPMSVINKTATAMMPSATTSTGRAYAATLFEATAIKRLADGMGKTYGIGAIILTHGESDSGSPTYEADMLGLWSDYNQDLPPLTGQATSVKIPMLVSQQSTVPAAMGQGSVATVAQWKVGVDHPGDIICIGPKYQYSYARDSVDHIHMAAKEYQKLGEKFGQVYFERVVLGRDWQPLQPIDAQVSGKVITVRFHVPVPPLVWDDAFPPAHPGTPEWTMGRGFEVRAASAPATIDSVEIVGDDTVKITCRSDLSGLAVSLAYAFSSAGVFRTKPSAANPAIPDVGTFRWGHLRDSDPFVGAVTQTPQPNYAVTFQRNVP